MSTPTTTPTTVLLLPAVPRTGSTTAATVNFWRTPLAATFARLPRTPPSLLYIGAPAPFATASRRASFPAAQRLLTALYALVYDLAATNAAFDTRIVLLSDSDSDSGSDVGFGPVMSLEQLADLHEWDQLLCPHDDAGYQLQGRFLAAAGSPSVRINYVDAGQFAMPGAEDAPGAGQGEGEGEGEGGREGGGEREEHAIVAVGGTFDHLHLGHKLLLTCTAYLATARIIVGLTGPEMLRQKKHAEQMEPWRERAQRTLEFLAGVVDVTPYDCRGDGDGGGGGGGGNNSSSSSSSSSRETVESEGRVVTTFREWREGERRSLTVEIVELRDLFGPTITEEGVTALVVTRETEAGGAAVNRKREEMGWAAVDVGVVDLLMDGDEKLSSTELRRRQAATATATVTT